MKFTFFWGAILTLAAKLWLTSDIRIVPAWLPHDSQNYVSHARAILAGAWFGAYTNFTLIKEPFYPIYLALVQEIGLTLPLANALLYAGACVLACIAVRPLVRSSLARIGIFIVLMFNPMTYADLAWIATRSELNDSLALAATACALAILIRRRKTLRALIGWWLGLGIAFTAFWLTREESIWLVPGLVAILGAYVVAVRKDGDRWVKLCGLALPLCMCYVTQAAIGLENQHKYGWNTTVETKAPEFVSAYNSLARIVPLQEEYRISVPRSSREIAYRVSPAARELEPGLEGSIGKNWTAMVCKYQVHICNDIAGSYFVWAFRDSVAAAGHYSSGGEARLFYLRLASEIDRACDSGQIRCRAKAMTIFPNPTLSQVPEIVSTFRDGVTILTTFSQFSLSHPVVPINPVLDDEYTFVVGSISHDGQGFQGWLATDSPMAITVEGATGEPETVNGFLRMESADVATALTRQGHRNWDDQHARFSFTSDCANACFMVVTDAQNHQVKIPLSSAAANFTTPHVIYHLDDVVSPWRTYDEAFKQRFLLAVAREYQTLVPIGAILCGLLLIARILRAAVRKRVTFPSPALVLIVSVAAGAGLLVAILAVLTVSYSAGFSPEYLSSSVPLMLFALSVAVACEGAVAHRLIRPRVKALGLRSEPARMP